MLCDLPVELLALILNFLDLVSLKNTSETCQLIRAVCSDNVLNPWHAPVRRAIDRLVAVDQGQEESLDGELVGPPTSAYPSNLAATPLELQELTLLATLGEHSTVPRSTLVDVLALSPPRFLLYRASHPNLPRKLWEDAFRRRFLPSWRMKLESRNWSWREGFFRTLGTIHHKLTSNCTSSESWISYVVILRSGIAANCTAYARTFSAAVIMGDLKRQANLIDYETQARVIVQLADVRVVMLGVLRKPPYFAINTHARELLHPPGVEKPQENTHSKGKQKAFPESPRTSVPSSYPSPNGFMTPTEPVSPPTSARRNHPLRASRTRSPSRERRRDSNALKLSRTWTHESTGSTAASTSSASRGILGRLRRWTYGSNNAVGQPPQPDPSVSPLVSIPGGGAVLSPTPSRVTSASNANQNTPHNSTPDTNTLAGTPAYQSQTATLPQLRRPEPVGNYAKYPNYTPGGGDTRWVVKDGLDEGGSIWVGPILLLAQLIPQRNNNVENASDVFTQGHFVSFRWEDLIAIAPWMEERLTRRDNGLTI